MRTEARFPALDQSAGHYESFYLKACDPGGGTGVWIRYTVHKRPGQAPKGSLWFTRFGPDGPRAVKMTTEDLSLPPDRYIGIGPSWFGPDAVQGSAAAEGLEASWNLEIDSPEPPLHHLPREWMYRAPVPRTKLLSPHPGAFFCGRVTAGGEQLALERWPGMVGHNWGAEHAERWIWMHASFHNPGTWLDMALGRIRLGPLTVPWIANGALSLDGRRHQLGGLERVRATKVHETPAGAEFVLPGKGIEVRGRVSAPPERFVGWIYADPDGSEHNTVNCSVSDMELTVTRDGGSPAVLRASGMAAYELGMRETDHGMDIQPFPDG
jgi:hypothetical protein